MIKIGNYNTLQVKKFVDFGVYLDGGNGVEILLPAKYVDPETVVGDWLDVFVYTDSEDRLIATAENPFATVGEFAFLQVVDVNNTGAFLDWGISGKDLLVPYREQKVKMVKGGIYPVYVYLDDTTKRVAASAKIEKYLGNRIPEYRRGAAVKILPYQHTELGYKCVVDNLFQGIIYQNEIFRPVEIGALIDGYVKHVREDGKIDITLSGEAGARTESLAAEILEKINQNNGRLPVGDKSSPELIKDLFGCSKKDFKKAAGLLYKQHCVTIGDDYIAKVNY